MQTTWLKNVNFLVHNLSPSMDETMMVFITEYSWFEVKVYTCGHITCHHHPHTFGVACFAVVYVNWYSVVI